MRKWIKKTCLWTGGLATAIIAGLIIEYTKEYPIPGTIWNGMCYLWGKIIALMTIDLKLWWMFILVGVVILIKYTMNSLEANPNATKNNKQSQISKPKILNYTSEYYKGILWKFSWELRNNQWSIKELTPCCPNDETPLCYTRCPRCDRDYFGVDGIDSEKAAILIIDNARRLLQND